MVTRCACGFPVVKRTSWTSENPGRKFLGCKFYNHETGHSGCNTFEWYDREEPTDWQREVINVLLAEKHRLATDNQFMKSRLVCVEHEKSRLGEELEKQKNKEIRHSRLVAVENEKNYLAEELEKLKKESALKNDQVGVNMIAKCVLVSVVLSFIFVKLFG